MYIGCPNQYYSINVVLVQISHYSYLSQRSVLQASIFLVFLPYADPDPDSDSVPVGIIIGVAAVLIVGTAVGLFFGLRKKKLCGERKFDRDEWGSSSSRLE